MSSKIKTISTDDLRRMEDREGLILQGCGGDPQEWVDGINRMLADAGILLDDSRFEAVSVFQHDGLTNLLFLFDGVKLDIGKLAMWRLATHEQFGGTWLSDYVPNRLGGFVREPERFRPPCPLMGQDGNIFNLIGIAARTLREHDMDAEAKEMSSRVMRCHSYHEALAVISEYVETELSPALDRHTKQSEKRRDAHDR